MDSPWPVTAYLEALDLRGKALDEVDKYGLRPPSSPRLLYCPHHLEDRPWAIQQDKRRHSWQCLICHKEGLIAELVYPAPVT